MTKPIRNERLRFATIFRMAILVINSLPPLYEPSRSVSAGLTDADLIDGYKDDTKAKP